MFISENGFIRPRTTAEGVVESKPLKAPLTIEPSLSESPSPPPDPTPLGVLRLSARPHFALIQADITTIGQLSAMSREQIREVRNVSEKGLTEIEEKLAAYLAEHRLPDEVEEGPPEPEAQAAKPLPPQPSSPPPDPTPLGVLGLSFRLHNALLRAGITTIGQLATMSHARLFLYASLSGEITTVGQLAMISDEQIREVRNVGEKALAEIEEKMAAYLAEHPLPDKAEERPPEPEAWSPEPLPLQPLSPPPDPTSLGVLGLSARPHLALSHPMPDNIYLLFEDVAQLPIITSACQEMWLGIQIKATERSVCLCNEAGLGAKASKISSAVLFTVYETLLVYQAELENTCAEAEIQPPKIEAWVTELLSVRQNIFDLRRSRLQRFVQALTKITDKSVRGKLTDLAYSIAELLCLLPDNALSYMIEYAQTFEHLPSMDDVVAWLETSSVPESVLYAVRRQATIARDTLVTGYIRYALRVARKYVDQGLDYADLAQEGFLGLIKAAERFDYREQTRFAIYATSWIWQSIGRAIADQSRTIRLPVHLQEQIRKLERAYEELVESGENYPTVTDILFQTDLLPDDDLEVIKEFRDQGVPLPESIAKRYKKAVKRVQKLMAYAHLTIPLETLPELIPDRDNPAPSTIVDQADIKSAVEQLLEGLTPREREVMTLRFGLEDGVERTLEGIGQKFGMTRERIRQIQAKALEKLHLQKHALGRALSDVLLPAEFQTVYLPPEVLDYLDNDLGYWKRFLTKNKKQGWYWLDRLIDELPGGDWRRARSSDGMTRQDQLVYTLRALSAPAHYSDITEQLNEALEEEELDEGYVYTLLTKYEETFILLGQGVFSLLEWERERASQGRPVLPFCPSPLPDPPGQSDAFFESVLIARDILEHYPTADQFLQNMLEWAEASVTQQKWFLQSVLSSYYLVGLIPYIIFWLAGTNPCLECTLPEMDIHGLRGFCLRTLTERLIAMPEFWWALQRYQPVHSSVLGEQFADIHPLGLDDTTNRLSVLTSLGAVQKLAYGRYRLTSLGEELADQWKRRPALSTNVEDVRDRATLREEDLEFIDLAIW